jgi:hypothetical protein
MMANRVSTRPIFDILPATLMSQAKAISKPPPNATPSMAAMVGTGKSCKSVIKFLPVATNRPTSSILIFALSLRSAPAQNAPEEKFERLESSGNHGRIY